MAHKYKANLGNLEDGICVVELEHILMSCTLNYTDTDKLLQIKSRPPLPISSYVVICITEIRPCLLLHICKFGALNHIEKSVNVS